MIADAQNYATVFEKLLTGFPSLLGKDWLRHENFSGLVASAKAECGVLMHNLHSDIAGKSSCGEHSKQYDLYDSLNEKSFIDLRLVVQDIARGQGALTDKQSLNLLSAWTVVGGENSYHTVHKHNEADKNHIVSVFYLGIPPRSSSRSGDFYCFLNGSVLQIQPKVGDLLVFPAHVLHGAYPQEAGYRQTLNLDFEIIEGH